MTILDSLRTSRDTFLLADRQASAAMCSDFIAACFVVGPDFYRNWSEQLAERASRVTRDEGGANNSPSGPSHNQQGEAA